jgi:hypothetical protein
MLVFRYEATISFVMSVRPSAWKKLAPTRRIFMKFDILGFFENQGHAVAQLIEVLPYKSQGRGFDSGRCNWNFS